jgi:hypothetical protein
VKRVPFLPYLKILQGILPRRHNKRHAQDTFTNISLLPQSRARRFTAYRSEFALQARMKPFPHYLKILPGSLPRHNNERHAQYISAQLSLISQSRARRYRACRVRNSLTGQALYHFYINQIFYMVLCFTALTKHPRKGRPKLCYY